MYDNSKGVRQNTAAAKKWFGKACDNGDQEGCDNYPSIRGKWLNTEEKSSHNII